MGERTCRETGEEGKAEKIITSRKDTVNEAGKKLQG